MAEAPPVPPADPGAPQSEAELLEACRRGEPAAFEALIERYGRQVYRIAFRLLQNRVEAEDVVQEVFVRVHRAVAQFRGESRLATWLYRIAVNVCVEGRRRVKRRRELPLEVVPDEAAPDTDPSDRAAFREFAARAAAALHDLPPRQRATLVLRLYEELSLQEIADVLEAPLGTVKANLHHGLLKLRRALQGLGGPASGA